jgi:hypothetical protein
VIAEEQALVITNLRKRAKVILTRESEVHQVDWSSEYFLSSLFLPERNHYLRFASFLFFPARDSISFQVTKFPVPSSVLAAADVFAKILQIAFNSTFKLEFQKNNLFTYLG